MTTSGEAPPRERRRRGRPSVLTPEKRALMLKAVRAGAPVATAAEAAGIGRSTIFRQLADPRNAQFRHDLQATHREIPLSLIAALVKRSRTSAAAGILWLQITDPLMWGPIRGRKRRSTARAAVRPDGVAAALLQDDPFLVDLEGGADDTASGDVGGDAPSVAERERTARPIGRPRAMTPERQARVLRAIRVGATKSLAAYSTGVGESTLHAYLDDPHNAAFARTLAQAHAEVEFYVMANLTRLTRRSSRACLFLLDHLDPGWIAAGEAAKRRAARSAAEGDQPAVLPMPDWVVAEIEAATSVVMEQRRQADADRAASAPPPDPT